MNVPAAFADPNPVAFTVRSGLRRDAVLDRLESALAVGGYYETESRDPRYLGLDGSVAAGSVNLTVRPYIRPGERQIRGVMPITVRGDVVSTADGTEVRATATARVGQMVPTVAAAALAGWMLIGIAGGPFVGVFALVGGGFIAVVWTWIIRRNQRAALGKVDELAGILTLILNDS